VARIVLFSVILGNGETSVAIKVITHGACDFLLKLIQIEEWSNIQQHVVRKSRTSEPGKGSEHSASFEDGGERHKQGGGADQDIDDASSATNTTDGMWRKKKKKEVKDGEEDLEQQENNNNNNNLDDHSMPKKPHVVWSVDLHQYLVSFVNQLGIDSKSFFSKNPCWFNNFVQLFSLCNFGMVSMWFKKCSLSQVVTANGIGFFFLRSLSTIVYSLFSMRCMWGVVIFHNLLDQMSGLCSSVSRSHVPWLLLLQKYWLYLKRLNGVASQPNNLSVLWWSRSRIYGGLISINEMLDCRT